MAAAQPQRGAQRRTERVAWSDNDTLARELIAEGHQWERVVADRLRSHGLRVHVPDQSVRADVSHALRGDYAGTTDLHVEGLRVQVKSRRVREWYDPMYLCSSRAWEHDSSADAWICISQITGQALCVSGQRARMHSRESSTHDARRGISSLQVRTLALRYWSPLERMVEWMQAQRPQLPDAEVESWLERVAILDADGIAEPERRAAQMVWPDCTDVRARVAEAQDAARWLVLHART